MSRECTKYPRITAHLDKIDIFTLEHEKIIFRKRFWERNRAKSIYEKKLKRQAERDLSRSQSDLFYLIRGSLDMAYTSEVLWELG